MNCECVWSFCGVGPSRVNTNPTTKENKITTKFKKIMGGQSNTFEIKPNPADKAKKNLKPVVGGCR